MASAHSFREQTKLIEPNLPSPSTRVIFVWGWWQLGQRCVAGTATFWFDNIDLLLTGTPLIEASGRRDSRTSVVLGDIRLVKELRRGTGRLSVPPGHERHSGRSEQKDRERRERRSRHHSGHGPEPREDAERRGTDEKTNETGARRQHAHHTFRRRECRKEGRQVARSVRATVL